MEDQLWFVMDSRAAYDPNEAIVMSTCESFEQAEKDVEMFDCGAVICVQDVKGYLVRYKEV